MKRSPGQGRTLYLALVALPLGAGAALFLIVNAAQNGTAFMTGYERYIEFCSSPESLARGLRCSVPLEIFEMPSLSEALSTMGTALLRLNFGLFGWPFSLLLIALALRAKSARILWATVAFHTLVHCGHESAGIDTFGPVYFLELSLPILILTALGLQRFETTVARYRLASKKGRRASPLPARDWATAAVGGLVLAALVGYAPVRLGTARKIARVVNVPLELVRKQGIRRAVVFVPTRTPFVNPTCLGPTGHYVQARPNNDPELTNDVLWLNHLTLERDRDLMKRMFPDRTGYLMVVSPNCRTQIGRLDMARRAPPPQS
jgi:hypothetical protein